MAVVQPSARLRWCPSCRAIYRADFARCPGDGEQLLIGMTDPMLGQTIGKHYVVDTFLGEGAMARVYRAHHALLEHKQFAVKIMIGDFAATLEMRLRFAAEADAASQLDHPNVVSVVDFGKTDTGLMFIVMELVDGRSLADMLDDEGAIPHNRALGLVRQMCLGLGHAHGRGLVHRDLKPDNIVVSNGVVRIVDFGLAIPVDDEHQTRLTGVGLAMGTPIYCAPEQTHNEVVDHRADLFALGVTLYEMLAGRPPYQGAVIDIIRQNASDAPPTILERSGVIVPANVEAIARKLMRRDPDDRFATAAEVVAAIDAVVAVRTVALPTAPRSRSKAPFVVAGLALVGAAAWFGVTRRAPDSSPLAAVVAAPLPVAREPVVIAPAHRDVAPTPTPVARPQKIVPARHATSRATSPRVAMADVVRAPVIEEPPAPVPVEVAHEPTPIPTPGPVPAPPPVAAPAPPTLFTTANVSIAALRVHGSLADDDVRRAVTRVLPAMQSCYRSAARTAQRSPATTVRITLAIDDSRRASNISAQSPGWDGLAHCAATATDALRVTTSPDVGDVQVAFDLAFRPVSP